MDSQNMSFFEDGTQCFIIYLFALIDEEDDVNFGQNTENNPSVAAVDNMIQRQDIL